MYQEGKDSLFCLTYGEPCKNANHVHFVKRKKISKTWEQNTEQKCDVCLFIKKSSLSHTTSKYHKINKLKINDVFSNFLTSNYAPKTGRLSRRGRGWIKPPWCLPTMVGWTRSPSQATSAWQSRVAQKRNYCCCSSSSPTSLNFLFFNFQ